MLSMLHANMRHLKAGGTWGTLGGTSGCEQKSFPTSQPHPKNKKTTNKPYNYLRNNIYLLFSFRRLQKPRGNTGTVQTTSRRHIATRHSVLSSSLTLGVVDTVDKPPARQRGLTWAAESLQSLCDAAQQ